MDSGLPSYTEFVKLERKTLTRVRNELARYAVLRRAGDDAYKCLVAKQPKGFDFATHWDVECPSRDCRVILGAIIRKAPNHDKIVSMSHYLCIVEGREPVRRILRKFHFDYVNEADYRRGAHPRFHVQYGGELTPAMKLMGVEDKHIQPLLPSVEGPRIFFWPMTLALLMNVAFYEFPTTDTDTIKRTSEWLSLLRENERIVLAPFYELCCRFAGKDAFVFSEKIYVN